MNREKMEKMLKSSRSKPLKWYKKGKVIRVDNIMQKNYTYRLSEDPGKNFDPKFTPKYTPGQMLKMGVFEGKYCNDQIFEFPKEWYFLDKMSPEAPDPSKNYFKIKSRQSIGEWKRKGWIPCHPDDKDTRGWFEWYMRYWIGRRMPEVDAIQIKRWRAFARHYAQVKKNTTSIKQRPKQRQALLQWAWPCRVTGS